jgi:hypothetical protein
LKYIIAHMNPYKIAPPFLLSFSGGRTSGMMLRGVLDAYGGTMPAGGHVVFANTGTLDSLQTQVRSALAAVRARLATQS